jgi:hypothetical protein
VNQKLFEKLDEVLGTESEYRYIILLADSGMGKSSALINYCARHLRKIKKTYKIALIPLGVAEADQRIKEIDDKKNTVLFLDALDEDVLAIADHIERLRLLVEATRSFRRVLITCRTQFFAKDEEIPTRTGIIKVGARGASEPAEYYFHKLYLSPFSDVEIDRYLRNRYPWWEPRKRQLARSMVQKIPNLSARPMLLSHIDILIRRKLTIRFSSELYEEMIEAWLLREKGFISSPSSLRQFSERLAVDLYIKRDIRGSERASKPEVEALAREWGIDLDSWQLTGRSLLNRDAEGNYKFAHRSIMEYLFISRFLHGDLLCLNSIWTDQMEVFLTETFKHDCDELAKLHPGNTCRLPSVVWGLRSLMLGKSFVISGLGIIVLNVLYDKEKNISNRRLMPVLILLSGAIADGSFLLSDLKRRGDVFLVAEKVVTRVEKRTPLPVRGFEFRLVMEFNYAGEAQSVVFAFGTKANADLCLHRLGELLNVFIINKGSIATDDVRWNMQQFLE